jgi:prolyl 4-hydroxylase
MRRSVGPARISLLRYTPELVERLMADGQLHFSYDLVRVAAAEGNPDALFDLAVLRLTGRHVPRDLAGARNALRAAVGMGHRQALRLHINLAANGSGAPADWPGALRNLEVGARTDRAMSAELGILRRMMLKDDGFPQTVPIAEILCKQPRIRLIKSFLSAEECRHLVTGSADLLRPSLVADPVTGALSAHPVRSSDSAVIGPMREDLVISAINRRIAAATNTLVLQGEPLNVLRYRPGDQYRWHLDALPGVANQRAQTVLLYLNDGYAGGETAFAYPKLTVAGAIGDALVFDNVLDQGLPDPRTRHAGLPIRAGCKNLAARWLRQRPVDIWRPETLR